MMFIDQPLFDDIRKSIPICCVDLVFIDSNSRILLMNRRNNPAKNLLWFPGGRILKDELIINAINRKSLEEVSIKPISATLIDVQETIFEVSSDYNFIIHTINLCHLISWSGRSEDVVINDNQHDAIIWVPLLEALNSQNIHPGVLNPLKKIPHDH